MTVRRDETMRTRLTVALIALAGLPAFAPAPLPRTARRADPNLITLQNFQGDWKAVRFDYVRNNDKLDPIGLWFQGVRVRGDRWVYLVDGKENLGFRIAIGDGRPAAIDYYELQGNADRPGMVGLIKREGNRVTILYYATTPENRPKAFTGMPVNWWLLVLER
jgi:uncharacterized protein (TIGR03067 family)